ncbi:MAG: hypoxanthine phosphoribosyltransferase [Clostridiales bacterium]|nr:hypoxanthine phosphoribosyltransferase [Clostridiales bacterium]
MEERKDIETIMLTERQIHNRVVQIGHEISKKYKGKDLLLVGILKGAFVFFSDLVRSIDIPMAVDFMAVSSYGNETESSGIVRIMKDLDDPIEGKDVLIIEDILDTGHTLNYLLKVLNARKPASIKLCVLLDKFERREVMDIVPDFTGFKIENEFVVGYGLDYGEKYRNLPYVGVLKPSIYED